MEITQGVQYSFSRDGQTYGPFDGSAILQMAQLSQLLSTDYIWTQGMSEWLPASSFPQLNQIYQSQSNPLAETPPITTPTTPAAEAPKKATASVQTAVDQTGVLNVRRPGVTGPGIKKADIQTQAQPYSVTSANRAPSQFKPLLISFIIMLGGMLLSGAFFAFTIFGAAQAPDSNVPSMLPIGIFVGGMISLLAGLFYIILSLKRLYHGWLYLQDLPDVTTTPGKAIGFQFIPFFNMVWIFFAYYKWAVDYNRRCHESGLPQLKTNEGLFLAHCILTLLGLPVLHIFIMREICRGIESIELQA